MFSRKKNDLLIEPIYEEGRAFFRVEPSKKKPVNLFIKSHKYKIKVIGDGGIGVYRSGNIELEIGEEYSFEMTLPLIDEAISGTIRIVDISEKTCQCAFVDLGREDTDKIQLFVFETQNEETSAFFRVQPPSKDPIDVSIGIHTYQIKDIGAGGIRLRRNGDTELELGKEYLFKFTLPLINEMISGIIRIVNISDTTYHSVFVEISDEDKEYIHLFVLEIQKDKLRKKRKK